MQTIPALITWMCLETHTKFRIDATYFAYLALIGDFAQLLPPPHLHHTSTSISPTTLLAWLSARAQRLPLFNKLPHHILSPSLHYHLHVNAQTEINLLYIANKVDSRINIAMVLLHQHPESIADGCGADGTLQQA